MIQKYPFIAFLLKTVAVIWISVTTFFVTFGFFFILLIIFLSLIAAASTDEFSENSQYKTLYGNDDSENKLLSIPVTGLILGDKEELGDPFSFLNFGVSYGYEIKRQLYD